MTIVYLVVAALVGGAVVYLFSRARAKSLLNKAQLELSRAETEIKDKKREAETEK